MSKIIIPNFLNAKESELSATKKVNGNNTNYKLYLNGGLIFDYDILKHEDSSQEYDKGIQCSLIVAVVDKLLMPNSPKRQVRSENIIESLITF